VRSLAIAGLVLVFGLAAPAGARADDIWCGTFEDAPRPAPPEPRIGVPRGPALRVRVQDVLVDGARDRLAARAIDGRLSLSHCLEAVVAERGAAWHLELAVSPDGTVVQARVKGEPRGLQCVHDSALAIRFAPGPQLRIVSARVIAMLRKK
jgi:hypothetical protein